MVDYNNQGAGSKGVGDEKSITPAYFSAIIEDIIINEKPGLFLRYNKDGSNIGQVLVRIIPDDWNLPIEQLKSAFPLESNIQNFPIIGEQVIVFKTLGGLFYTRAVSTRKRITENRTSLFQYIYKSKPNNSGNKQNNRELAKQGISSRSTERTTQPTTIGFPVNYNTRPLRANQGDVIISGRYGNFIRMGSSLFINPNEKLPEPNIILTAGAWDKPTQLSTGGSITPYSLAYENINKDKSSIWMVANQQIAFTPSTIFSTAKRKAHLLSSEARTADYTGAQIFINSDRVILNSKKNEISLFSTAEINLSAIKSITLDTERSIYLRSFRDINIKADDTITLEAKQLAFASIEDLAYRTAGNYSITGKRIFIGKHGDISQPLVLGASLAAFLQRMVISLIAVNTSLTTVATAAGVVTPTTVNTLNAPGTALLTATSAAQTTLTQLLTALGGPLPQLAVFNSRSNFTAESNSI